MEQVNRRWSAIVPRRCLLGMLVREPRRFRDRFRWPLVVLVVGAFLDGVMTYRLLQTIGAEAELHPVQRVLFSYVPPMLGILLAKGGQVTAAVLVAAWWEPWCKWLMYLAGGLYLLAALSNHFGWV